MPILITNKPFDSIQVLLKRRAKYFCKKSWEKCFYDAGLKITWLDEGQCKANLDLVFLCTIITVYFHIPEGHKKCSPYIRFKAGWGVKYKWVVGVLVYVFTCDLLFLLLGILDDWQTSCDPKLTWPVSQRHVVITWPGPSISATCEKSLCQWYCMLSATQLSYQFKGPHSPKMHCAEIRVTRNFQNF